MNIKIVRQYDSRMKVVGDLTYSNWRSYATKHGYFLKTTEVQAVLEEANRKKLVAVRDEIQVSNLSYDDWLFWADADSVVTKMEKPLTELVAAALTNHHLIFDVSHYGLSTGNFFARNTPLARELLSAAITCGNPTDEVNAMYAKIQGSDESTLKHLIASFPFFKRHTTTVKMADFPREHTKESFILHAAQRSTEERIALLSPYCQ